MNEPKTPEQALALIEYLVSKGKRPKSFENAFPRIHHFKGASGNLQAHIKYITGPDAAKTYTRKTNQNIAHRLELIKSYVDEFHENNPGWDGINEFKYQTFAARAVEEVPL